MNPTRASPRSVEATATPPAPPSRGRRRALIVLAVLLALAVVAAIGGRAWLRSYYYVGERDGSVAVLRGAPGSVLGVALQELTLQGCVSDDGTVTLLAPDKLTPTCNVLQLADLQPAERTQVSNGLPGTSLTDARAQITRLVTTSLLPLCTVGKPGAAASRTPTAPTSSTPASASASSLSSPSSATGSSATGSSTPTSTQPTGTDLAAPDQEPGQNCRTGR